MHGNILDVVLSNFDLPDEPSVIEKLPVGLSSDHYIILISLPVNTHTSYCINTPNMYFDYSKANWIGMH